MRQCALAVKLMAASVMLGALLLWPHAVRAQDGTGSQTSLDLNQREEQMYNLLQQADPLMKEKKFVQARKILRDAVPLDPTHNSGNLHSMLGFADQQLGDLEEAISENQLAMKFEPKLVDLCWNVAMAYKDLGDYDKARDWITQYLNSNPTDAGRKRDAEEMMKKLGEQAGLNASQDIHAPDYLDGLVAQHGAGRWPRQSFPLKIFVERSEGIPGVPADSMDMLQSAFDSWNKASGGNLPVELVNNHKKANIVIRWTNKPDKVTAHDGVHLEQGVTRVMKAVMPGASIGMIQSADITLLTVSRQTGEPLDEEEMKAVCLHEVGHALGLGGHSSNSADTMYFSSSARQLPALSHRDKATIARLYTVSAPIAQQMPYGNRGFTPFAQRTGFGQPPFGQGGFPTAQAPYMQRPNPYMQQQQNPYMPQQQNPYGQNPYMQQQQAGYMQQQQPNPYPQQNPYNMPQQSIPYPQQQPNPYPQQQPNPFLQQQPNPYLQQQPNPYLQQQPNPYLQQQPSR